jgi:hypothetical protein
VVVPPDRLTPSTRQEKWLAALILSYLLVSIIVAAPNDMYLEAAVEDTAVKLGAVIGLAGAALILWGTRKSPSLSKTIYRIVIPLVAVLGTCLLLPGSMAWINARGVDTPWMRVKTDVMEVRSGKPERSLYWVLVREARPGGGPQVVRINLPSGKSPQPGDLVYFKTRRGSLGFQYSVAPQWASPLPQQPGKAVVREGKR